MARSLASVVRILMSSLACLSAVAAPASADDRGFAPPGDERCDSIFLNCNSTVQANLAGFTSNPNDPAFTCRFGGAGRGFNTAWYSFIAQGPTATLSTGSAGGAATDSLLAVYSGNECGIVTQIACDDDSGNGNLSLINLTGLTTGNRYYVQLAAFSDGTVGTYTLNLDCRPPYDECAGAINLACNSAQEVNLGITTTNPADPIFPCRLNPPPGPPVPGVNSAWLRFTAGAPNMRLTVLATDGSPNQNTLLAAYIGLGCGQLSLFSCNDDAGSPGLSGLDFTGIEVGREFWVQIAANSAADVRKYRVLLECNPGCADCVPGAVQENEICGFDTNGLCTSGQPISCAGANICGTLSPAFGSQPVDVDLYSFTLDGTSVVSLCVASPQRLDIAILGSPFCPSAPVVVYASGSTTECGAACVNAALLPGSYLLGIALADSDASCGAANHYAATFSAGPYCPGDFNQDNRIDTADLIQFISAFGVPPFSDCSKFDLNEDGVVGTGDLVRFISRFGGLCLPPPPPPMPATSGDFAQPFGDQFAR